MTIYRTPWSSRIAALLAVLLASGCSAGNLASSPTAEEQAYHWLTQQQRITGLLGNQEDDAFSGMYSVAVAAMCFIRQGDLERAERAFAAYAQHADTAFAEDTPGGFHQFWDAVSGAPHTHTDRWLGDNAWLLIALNYYRDETGNARYDELRRRMAEWIIGLQDEDGGILSGFTTEGPMSFKSTEGNLDCYAALADYPEQRARILKWLEEEMWVAEEARFKMGSTNDDSAMDCTSWAVGALGPAYAGTLDYAEDRFKRTDTSDATGESIAGFADFLDKERVWFEGTGQMAVAYRVAGREEEAEAILKEIEKGMVPSARFPGAAGLPCTSSNPTWEGATTKIFVPSQAWYLFGRWNFNPLAPGTW